jgi:DNA-binding NtrC family response regulator
LTPLVGTGNVDLKLRGKRMARPAEIVLIVEEDPEHALELCQTLRLLRLDAEIVGHVHGAKARLASPEVALVIANLRLPDGGGVDLLAPALESSLPVILMTEGGRLDLETRARAVGACAVLRKPFVTNEVLNAIGAGLEERWRLRTAN